MDENVGKVASTIPYVDFSVIHCKNLDTWAKVFHHPEDAGQLRILNSSVYAIL